MEWGRGKKWRGGGGGGESDKGQRAQRRFTWMYRQGREEVEDGEVERQKWREGYRSHGWWRRDGEKGENSVLHKKRKKKKRIVPDGMGS